VIVWANNRILVLPRSEVPRLKQILERLPAEIRDLPS
jgi:hypothetical protein